VGLTVVWDNTEKTVVRFIYGETWTWEDFHSAISAANQMMDSVEHPVVSIVDLSQSRHVPDNPTRHIRQVVNESRNHNNSNISVFLNADDFVQAICHASQRIYLDVRVFSKFYFADTLEEARILAFNLRQGLLKTRDTKPLNE
jgi:hypothetical protein